MNPDPKNPNRQAAARRILLGVGPLPALPVTTAGADSTPKATRTGLSPGAAPAADIGYTPGILADGRKLIFVSGQGPSDLNADMETQMRQTFERIGEVLKAGGATMENVVLLRSDFVNLSRDLPAYRKIRREYLSKPYPASTAVGVTELAIRGLQIE